MEVLYRIIILCVVFNTGCSVQQSYSKVITDLNGRTWQWMHGSFLFSSHKNTPKPSKTDVDVSESHTSVKPVSEASVDKESRELALRQHLVDCTEETKINPDIILKLRSGKWRQALRKEPPVLKRWTLCVLVKSGMMSPDGVLRQNVVLENVPAKDKARVEKVIDKCLFRKSHSPPDIAWHYLKCFRSTFPKYAII